MQEGAHWNVWGRGLKAFSKPTVPRMGEGEFQHQMHAGMAEERLGPEFPLVAGINRSDKGHLDKP